MDTETYSDDEFSAPGPDEFTLSGGGMFAGSQHFTVAGGTFNNIMKNYHAAPTVPPDFRMIQIGDIDLQRELTVNKESGVLGHRRKYNCVRRVYSAKLSGRKGDWTVAMYQGNGAEEDWGQDREISGPIQNIPSFPFAHHEGVSLLVSFLESAEWTRVSNYVRSLGQGMGSRECTLWIRNSTGRLSVDLVPPDTLTEALVHSSYLTSNETSHQQTATPSGSSNIEILAIESLELGEYHFVSAVCLDHQWGASISTSAAVNLGAVISRALQHQYEEHAEIAFLAGINFQNNGWQEAKIQELVRNGWSRWMSQANHVFSRLQITSSLEDYVLIYDIYFTITIRDAGENPPPGYLFLCPKEDCQIGPNSFTWPKIPAYWSLGPEGDEVLSTEEAARIGFPSFQLTTDVFGKFWDTSVYTGLHQFHRAKGFDPDSEEVALHPGYPL
ncbi:hypothetical protein C8F04DRAFT_1347072 [Mycena alexandri]|uniref:Uncharacterized protein n=1 Tax=Mycena alexandri TaxID=1745969 RepID=A0AAD6SWR5_9AGAR|nr:hypothetical protein C8F04DRAFT_1347072 [Mycena alexandri]